MFLPNSSKILLLCDHWLVSLGLKRLIEQTPGFTVCATVEDAESAREMIAQQEPDLTVIDVSGRNSNAVALMQALHSQFPELPVLAVSAHNEPSSIQDVLMAGAAGYVLKRDVADDLLAAIRGALANRRHVRSVAKVKTGRRGTVPKRRALQESGGARP